MGVGEDLAVDDVRLLPEDVGVERPHVRETEVLRLLGQLDDAPRRWVGLQYDTEIHERPSYRFCGNPRSTDEVDGSGQREVTTLARV